MQYNPRYKILWKFNPIAQCLLGQPFGWMSVMTEYNYSRKYEEGDEVKFVYTQSKWDELLKHIKKCDRERGV